MLGPKYFNKPLCYKAVEEIMKKYNVCRQAAEWIMYEGKNPPQPF